jgi:hypothetical protein
MFVSQIAHGQRTMKQAHSLKCSTNHLPQNNPLHIALFPCMVTAAEQTSDPAPQERDELEYSMMLNSCLDIFEARMPTKTAGHDFGLLQALDERLAMYGWLLNTGIKLVIVVDMEGRPAEAGQLTSALGLRNSDLTPVCTQYLLFD